MLSSKSVPKPRVLMSCLLAVIVFLTGFVLPNANVQAQSAPPQTIGDNTSLLLGQSGSSYVMPEVEGFNYNKLDLNSLYVLVRQISPYGRIDYLNSSGDKKVNLGALAQLMTYYVCAEYFHAKGIGLFDNMKITDEDMTRATELGGVLSGFVPGDEARVVDFLHAMLLAGGTEATFALVREAGSTEKAFVHRMNTAAEELGMKNTHFIDPAGIVSKGAYSTLDDMAILMEKLLQDKDFVFVMERREHYTPALASNPYGLYFEPVMSEYARSRQLNIDAINGGKTGASDDGYHFASFHKEGGSTYIILTSKAKEAGQGLADHVSILEKMAEIPFDYPLIAPGAVVEELPVLPAGGAQDSPVRQKVRAADGYQLTLPLLADLARYSFRYNGPETLTYPLTPGKEIGSYDILDGGSDSVYNEKLSLPKDPQALAGALATTAAATTTPTTSVKPAATTLAATAKAAGQTTPSGKATENKGTVQPAQKAAKPQEQGRAKISPLPIILLLALLAAAVLYVLYRRKRAADRRRRMARLQKLSESYAYRSKDAPDVEAMLETARRKREALLREEKERGHSDRHHE